MRRRESTGAPECSLVLRRLARVTQSCSDPRRLITLLSSGLKFSAEWWPVSPII